METTFTSEEYDTWKKRPYLNLTDKTWDMMFKMLDDVSHQDTTGWVIKCGECKHIQTAPIIGEYYKCENCGNNWGIKGLPEKIKENQT